MAIIGEWSFLTPTPSRERTAHWGELELFGAGAEFTAPGLRLTGGGYARAQKFTGAAIREKTLVSWLRLDNLADARPAGSAMTLDGQAADQFDAIVLGERQDRTWMAGSGFFLRTRDLGAAAVETRVNGMLKMAITYAADGNNARISVYRDDVLLGSYTQGSLVTWQANDAEILFGARHTLKGKALGKLDATLFGAQIHDCALTQAEIEALECPGGGTTQPSPDKSYVLECVARPGHYLTLLGGTSDFEAPAAVFRKPGNPAYLTPFRLRLQQNGASYLIYWTNLHLGHHGWCGKFGSHNAVQQFLPGLDGQFGTISMHQGGNPWGQVEYWRMEPTRAYGSVTLTDALVLAHRTNAPTSDADRAAYSFRLREI